MISIILIEPETSGNVGYVARAMKNFDFKELILINPKCNHLDLDAMSRATHARSLLKKAKIKGFSYLKNFDYLIASTAILGSDYNIARSPISIEELAKKVAKIKNKIGLMIGRESSGLNNKEINMADFIITIPASKSYPTLSISHSVAIILYELFKHLNKEKSDQHFVFASKKEKDVIMKIINKHLDKMEFSTKEKKETQKKIWKRILGKSFLTRREAFAIMGFFKKLR